MKSCLFLALPLLLVASPALATGGFDCRATDGSGIMLSGTIGRVITSPLVAAHLRLGDRTLATTDADPEIRIGRSWIDERELRVDLVDADAMRFEAQLRTRIGGRGRGAGTLVRNGVTHPVRCEVE
ncbi:hypothetical protein [Sphingosinicella terrae]|uniref:hypothetical protein n=1 Tax=Sphingosinicella terrae TaxID=2172047 RepID=UPI000E0DA013|nr:hypothetical protein [Sphingosinicella terrae]